MDEINDNSNHASNNDHKIPEERLQKTSHSVTINGKKISYTAHAGTMLIKKEEDEKAPKATAEVFYVSYTMEDQNPSDRPITYIFNGGPGSSSVWLHLGLYGPKRVISEKDEKAIPPPYQLVDNEYSLIDKTDMVFIDPVSTGWSRAVPGEKAEQFHSFENDLESVGEFIRQFTSRYNRWSSPKYLAGESYGTTRAAGLSGLLHMKHGLYLNGIMLISSVLNFQTLRFSTGNDLPNVLYLPTYTATAWYHNKLSDVLMNKSIEEVVEESRQFALNEYAPALMLGDRIIDDSKKYDDLCDKLSYYTGIDTEYIKQTNLRIEINRFVKELRRTERITVGRLDSRFTSHDRTSIGEMNEFDPSYAAIQGPYTATFNDYITRQLQFENDLSYNILANLYETWKYDKQQNQYLDASETLRKSLNYNPSMKIFVANGYYDLATPFFATEYTMDHLQIEPHLRNNLQMEYYDAGHMMYLKEDCLKKLKVDLNRFYSL